MTRWEWRSLWRSGLVWALVVLIPVLVGLIFLKTQADQATERKILLSRVGNTNDALGRTLQGYSEKYTDTKDQKKKQLIDGQMQKLQPLVDAAGDQLVGLNDDDNDKFLTAGQKLIALSQTYRRTVDPMGEEVFFSPAVYTQQLALYRRIQKAGLGFETAHSLRYPNFFFNLLQWFCAPIVLLVLALALHLTRLQDHWRGSNDLLRQNLSRAGRWPLARLGVDASVWLGLLGLALLTAGGLLVFAGQSLFLDTQGSWQYPLIVTGTTFMPLITACWRIILSGFLLFLVWTTLLSWAERYIRQPAGYVIAGVLVLAVGLSQWLTATQGMLLLSDWRYIAWLGGLVIAGLIAVLLTMRAYAQ
ncbi:hypothetical protein FMM01_15885 [Schleiferilactobacillus harbinensis]|uniref:hypothetical protein n=1 Tax=Schleiferilactobacillus harbinensis TaxID=304207 RepID=UPI00123BF324|nr:hypothetical protein [Schleiferilactobacillus harbinensis]QEU48677.1 hypothetical protein FMM01_15885 [Schleiferilactobacillus harbinensis]